MIHFSIPFWMFGTFIGVVCFGLLVTALIIGHKVRRLRSRKGLDAEISDRACAVLNNHFQHDLLGMQVDAVFNSLAALIETERVRLKSLVAPTVQSIPVATMKEHQPDEPAQKIYDVPSSRASEEQPDNPAQGSAKDPVPSGSGLSRAERELMEKMRGFQAQKHRKLEAVV
jgi:hypothetical protein